MPWQQNNGKLVRTFIFKDQTALAHFIVALAVHSDNVNHHADMQIRYNKLSITLITHDAHEITEKDRDLAAFLDVLYEKSSSKP